MTPDNEPPIEVEVIEIDGAAPPPPGHTPVTSAAIEAGDDDDDDLRSGHTWTNWQRLPGQARMLHPLWWPVLVVGGGILLAVVLTIVACVAVLLVIYRIVRGIFRALFG